MRRGWGCLALVLLTACSGAPQLVPVAAQQVAGAGSAGPVPATASSRVGPDDVEVFTNGAVASAALVAAVIRARRSIDAEIYEFDRPDLVAAMLAALRRGVAVRLIADPTVDITVGTAHRLAAAGAVVDFFPDRPRQIDHVKLLLVDGERAFFGGFNWGSRSYANQDYEVRLQGPAVPRLERLFSTDLGRAGTRAPSIPDTPADPSEPRLLTSFPVDEIGPAVVTALRGAQHSIEVEMFVMTDVATIAALVDAARRGLDVQVLFDPGQDLNMAAMVKLRAAGVRCRFYRSHGEKLHAKVAVIDGDLLILGSANWTASGFRHNHELDTVLVQPRLAAAVRARMDADWRAAA